MHDKDPTRKYSQALFNFMTSLFLKNLQYNAKFKINTRLKIIQIVKYHKPIPNKILSEISIKN